MVSDVILDNANVITMDETLPFASALAIAGGRILAGVDSREDAIASHAHERIDLQGATVMPGFVDAHVHFRSWALARVRLDLRGAASLDGMLAAVAAHAATLPAGGWVLGGGWPDSLAAPGDDIGAHLDAHAAGRPVALVSHDGHSMLVTAAALERLGIAGHELEQPGGIVDRDDTGAFTGLLRETSAWHVRRQLPEPDHSTRTMADAMRAATRLGVTCIHDMDGARGLAAWRELEVERGLSLRVVQHLHADDLDHARALGIDAGFGSERLRLGGLKVFADGTLGSGTAWLHEPDADDSTGAPLLDSQQLALLAREAASAGFSLLVHAIGDAAFTATVTALERTQEWWSMLRSRPRIEHAQLVQLDDLERCARLGVALSIQPTHMVGDRDLADERWTDRIERAYAWRSMVDAGCGILLGSDAPIEEIGPLAAIHVATTRDGGAHDLAAARGPWHARQAIDVETALRASTSWCADAAGMASEVGRLIPGRQADLVVLSNDPLSTPISEVEVVATMVGGRWTHGAASLY